MIHWKITKSFESVRSDNIDQTSILRVFHHHILTARLYLNGFRKKDVAQDLMGTRLGKGQLNRKYLSERYDRRRANKHKADTVIHLWLLCWPLFTAAIYKNFLVFPFVYSSNQSMSSDFISSLGGPHRQYF